MTSNQARYPHTHRSRDIWDSRGKVDLQACKDEVGNAANVPLLYELQHGAPRRKQVRILGTDAGDKRTLGKAGAARRPGRQRHTSRTSAAPGGRSCDARQRWGAGGMVDMSKGGEMCTLGPQMCYREHCGKGTAARPWCAATMWHAALG